MRFILLVSLLIVIGFGAKPFYTPAPAIVMPIGFILLFFGPIFTTMIKLNRYKAACITWLKNKGHNYNNIEPQPHMLFKGKLRWKVSDAQLVFSIKNCENEEYWFACGSWLMGTFVNKIRVFQNVNGKLSHVGSALA